jgi:hypothetical protein
MSASARLEEPRGKAYTLSMAISAVSSIGSGYLQLFRTPRVERLGAGETLSRVQAIPELAGREDADPTAKDGEAKDAEGKKSSIDEARALALDPRGPESILVRRVSEDAAARRIGAGRAESGRAADAQSQKAADKRNASSRLDELMGQKSAMERKQVEEKGSRSAEVLNVLSQLKSRDSEVRAHEAAHMAAGGRYVTGGASYTYEQGPDGGQYAVGGEVGIDTSSVPGHPEETAQKMRTVRAAALAPSEPSSADLSVAAAAAQAEAQALAEVAQNRAEELAGLYRKESDAAGKADVAKAGAGFSGEARQARPYSLDMVA